MSYVATAAPRWNTVSRCDSLNTTIATRPVLLDHAIVSAIQRRHRAMVSGSAYRATTAAAWSRTMAFSPSARMALSVAFR